MSTKWIPNVLTGYYIGNFLSNKQKIMPKIKKKKDIAIIKIW